MPHQDKLAPRAHPAVFLGYPPNYKAYKLYDLIQKKIIISRDVIFRKHIFPLHNKLDFPFISHDLHSKSANLYDCFPLVPTTHNPTFHSEHSHDNNVDIANGDHNVLLNNEHDSTVSIEATPTHTSTSDSTSISAPILRQSTRTHKPSYWLNDYVVHNVSSPLHVYSASHMLFLANLSQIQEPYNYKQARLHKEWITAMQSELDALESNHTWDLRALPPGQHPIGCKWVFNVKCKENGEVDKYKARLVAKGYNQIEGIDYFDSFSPVAKTDTVTLVLALVAAKSWSLHYLDINNSFLHGYLDEEIYMKPPEGYVMAAPGQFCRLKGSLYGLKQASRQWNVELTNKLLSYGVGQSHHDN
ncbi:transmembrane signal receptor [Lithospermum erythrorhizon]|uniref:Transmembrane signal receptor n=1 Tax=Lithospermum erythrorhizon TaxID=34254 RepID=A0AAV3NNJ3_LITER